MQTQAIGTSKAVVPIPIYRELAAELQVAQAKITQLQNHNERLLKQNQVLFEELETVLEMHQHTHTALMASQQRVSQVMTPPATVSPEIVITEADIPVKNSAVNPVLTAQFVQPPTLGTIESSPLNRSWVILMTVVILLTCFGVGFIVILVGPKR